MNIIYEDYNIYHNSIDICTLLDIFFELAVQRQRKD